MEWGPAAERTHRAMTLYYQRHISWTALIDCSSFTLQWTDASRHDCCCQFKSAWRTLSFSRSTATPGTRVVPDRSEVNWFGEACLWGSDWEAEGPLSVLCKVQSCVTYWHILVCLEDHWVLCRVLQQINLRSMGKKWRRKKTTSPCPVFCSHPGLDEYTPGANASGMQHQQRCLSSRRIDSQHRSPLSPYLASESH